MGRIVLHLAGGGPHVGETSDSIARGQQTYLDGGPPAAHSRTSLCHGHHRQQGLRRFVPARWREGTRTVTAAFANRRPGPLKDSQNL